MASGERRRAPDAAFKPIGCRPRPKTLFSRAMTLACRVIIAGTLLATLFGSFAAFAQAPPTGSGVVRLQYATAPIIYVNGNGNTVATNGSTASGTHTLQ